MFYKGDNFFFWVLKFNPYYAVGFFDQQNFTIISSAHGLYLIERIFSYFEIKNVNLCLRLKKNEVSRFQLHNLGLISKKKARITLLLCGLKFISLTYF